MPCPVMGGRGWLPAADKEAKWLQLTIPPSCTWLGLCGESEQLGGGLSGSVTNSLELTVGEGEG